MSDTPNILYTLPEPHGSDVAHVLAVGKEKPLAYVTYESIQDSGTTPEALRAELEGRGVTVLEMPRCPSFTQEVVTAREYVRVKEAVPYFERGEIFYAYDSKALGKILNSAKARHILREAKWPNQPDAFVKRIHSEAAALKTPLFDLISDCFGSTKHVGRTDQPVPDDWAHGEQLHTREARALESLHPDILSQGYGPVRSDVHLGMLHNRPISDDSARHYNAQYTHMVNELPADKRKALEEKRESERNTDGVKR